ncbi:MAG: TIGR02117 family protein [Rhodospirillales bacterium]|jgi:uncharacterized protein (TIGR02117 family)
MKICRRWFLLATLLLGAWPGLALLLGAIPAHPPPADPGPEGIEIALVSNGWHVDLVLPVEAGGIDLSADFPPADIAVPFVSTHIAIGWGDRNFYLETPRLRDLKPRTALNALLGRGSAVLHAMHLPGMPQGPDTRRLRISPDAYRSLAAGVQAALRRDETGKSLLIAGKGFGHSDAFYEAKGNYSPITTCNEWLAAHLRAAGLPVGLWSPLPSGLLKSWPCFRRSS